MDNDGWCYYHTYGKENRSGPSQAIDEHNGNIKYVSMTANKYEWIVGYGNTGWDSNGLNDSVIKAGREASDDGEIKQIILGKRSSLYVVESSKSWYYGHDNDEFSDAMKESKSKRLVAIW